MGYRDAAEALRDRSEALRARLRDLDEEIPSSARSLPHPVRERLARLREAAELSVECDRATEVQEAERAVLDYERALDEALGLHAQLHKSVSGLLPDRRAVMRWGGFAAAALIGLTGAVYELGLSDFMLRAFGAEVAIAHPQLTAGQVFLEVTLEAETPLDDPAPTDDEFFRLIVEAQEDRPQPGD